jgi:DNA repair exonuclease SbcCD nuclease subunit
MKKAIGIISTDWHLDKENFVEKEELIKQKIDLALKLKVKNLFCAGDIFIERKARPLIDLKYFDKLLFLIEKSGLNLYLIPGNHDKVNYNSDDSYLLTYKHYPNLFLFQTPSSIQIDEDNSFYFVPYYDELTSLYLEKLKSIQLNDGVKYHHLITHVSINSVKNNERNVVMNDIREVFFKDFTNVFVGHYHDRQSVGKNIHYIGSISQGNFGEDTKKGFTILYNDGTFEYVQSKFREFKQIEIKVDDNFSLKQVDELIKENEKSINHIRFSFVGKEVLLKNIDKKRIEQYGFDVKMKQIEIEQGIEKAKKEEFVSYNKGNLFEEFEEFCKEKKIENNKYGVEILTKKLR